MPSPLETLEQKRAKSAWKQVQEIKKMTGNSDEEKEKAEKFKKRYNGLARSMPAMIQNAGLGQSLAFLRAKDKGKHTMPEWRLYSHLSAWLASEDQIPDIKPNQLLEWLIEKTSDVYRHVTVEIIAYLRWLKRFAEAELPEPEGSAND